MSINPTHSDSEWRELAYLTESYLVDTLSDDEGRRLCELLACSDAMRRWFLQSTLVATVLHEQYCTEAQAVAYAAEMGPDDLFISERVLQDALESKRLNEIKLHANAMLERDLAEASALADTQPSHQQPQSNQRVIVIPRSLMYLAAVLALALILLPVLNRPEQQSGPDRVVDQPQAGPESPTLYVAHLSRDQQAVWLNEDPAPAAGDRMAAGVYRLESGTVEVEMDNGSVVLFAGPCEFELIEGHLASLTQGSLTASVPPRGKGFTVLTPSAKIVDFGTEFGISVDESGACLAAVFDGMVTVTESPNDPQAEPQRVVLTGGWETNIDAEGKLDDSIEQIDPRHVFVKNWRDARYQPKLQGDIVWLSEPPKSVAVEQLTSNNAAMVFLERSGVRLSETLMTIASTPGVYNAAQAGTDTLAVGTAVDSYLIHIDPSQDTSADEPTSLTRQGEIRFDREILAVIANGNTLCATDKQFGSSEIDYGRSDNRDVWQWYGIEHYEGPNVKPELQDRFEIGPDGRTLRFRLTCNGHLDQVRVLVGGLEESTQDLELRHEEE